VQQIAVDASFWPEADGPLIMAAFDPLWTLGKSQSLGGIDGHVMPQQGGERWHERSE
jgi:hypothetical protein